MGCPQSRQEFAQAKGFIDEVATVFGDFLGTTVADPTHSADEERYITVGLSSLGRVLLVAHTERDDRIRIISARTLTAKEKRAYENTKE